MKKILRNFLVFLITLMVVYGCKKQFADPTYAKDGTAVRLWYKTDPFYRPNAEIFLEATSTWRSFTSFPLVYDNDPNKYGFGNPYVPGKGSNALYMSTIYGALAGGLTSDSGYYNITIPKCFEFLEESPGATKGIVNVLPQQVRLYRKDKTFYDIGISGGGTYDEIAKIFEVEVVFDETAIGGPKDVKRKYRFKP